MPARTRPAIKLIGLAEVVGAVGLVTLVGVSVAELLGPIAGSCLTHLMIEAVVVHRRRRGPAGFQVVLTEVALGATVLAAVTMGWATRESSIPVETKLS